MRANNSFMNRLGLAWQVLTDPAAAARLGDGATAAEPEPQAPPPLARAEPDAALQLLGILQREGRFIDFLQENVSAYSDAEIGNAARLVHQGCQKALADYLNLTPVSEQQEQSRVTLEPGFDASQYRLTGNVVGEAPFTGTLVHRGWRADNLNLPQLAPEHDLTVLAPAEVEL